MGFLARLLGLCLVLGGLAAPAAARELGCLDSECACPGEVMDAGCCCAPSGAAPSTPVSQASPTRDELLAELLQGHAAERGPTLADGRCRRVRRALAELRAGGAPAAAPALPAPFHARRPNLASETHAHVVRAHEPEPSIPPPRARA